MFSKCNPPLRRHLENNAKPPTVLLITLTKDWSELPELIEKYKIDQPVDNQVSLLIVGNDDIQRKDIIINLLKLNEVKSISAIERDLYLLRFK